MNTKIRDIRKPGFMQDANTARGHNAVLEILIALVVFFVGDILLSILQMPAMIVHMLSSKEYMQMLQSGSFDMETILNTALNLPDWLTVVSLITEAGLIVVFILYCRLFEKRRAYTLGFRKKGFALEYIRGAIIGLAAFLAAYLLCMISGSVRFQASASEGFTIWYLVGFFIGYLIQGMAEEVICRGYLLVSLTRRYPVVVSVVISSLFFAFLHGLNAGMSFLSYLNLFLFGTVMALLFIRYENIWIVGAFHGIWNFMEGNVFGIQVSGLKKQPSLFTSVFSDDASLINGGSFGIEGGIVVTVVLLVTGGVLLWRMKKQGYFVEVEPIQNPYEQPQASAPVSDRTEEEPENSQKTAAAPYENMGFHTDETPWHPEPDAQEEKKASADAKQTEFDQSYFKGE